VEDKRTKFKRLAELRVNRIINDLKLISNLSNKSNYTYTEPDINKIFRVIDENLKQTKLSFKKRRKKLTFD
jgi:hypothetical protein